MKGARISQKEIRVRLLMKSSHHVMCPESKEFDLSSNMSNPCFLLFFPSSLLPFHPSLSTSKLGNWCTSYFLPTDKRNQSKRIYYHYLKEPGRSEEVPVKKDNSIQERGSWRTTKTAYIHPLLSEKDGERGENTGLWQVNCISYLFFLFRSCNCLWKCLIEKVIGMFLTR